MSVLKEKRTTSKAEFVNTANEIYTATLDFLTRLSARYARLVAEPVAKLAGEVMDYAEKANSFYTSDDIRLGLREKHLLLARASLSALDVRLTHCRIVMDKNPQGCFTDSHGKTIPPKEAEKRLEDMSQSLGELIDKEDNLLKGVLKSDADHRRKLRKQQ